MPGVRRSSRLTAERAAVHRRQPSFPDESDDDDAMAILEDDSYHSGAVEAGEEVEQFAKWLDECSQNQSATSDKRARTFHLVDEYYAFAQGKADTLRQKRRSDRLRRDDNGEDEMDVVAQDYQDLNLSKTGEQDELDRWTSEAQTWNLLRKILPLRYRDALARPVLRSTTSARTRKQYWDDFALSDNTRAERKAVIEWLQSNACAGPEIDELLEDHQKKADRGDIVTHGWLHTRSAIKLHKSVNAISRDLDPQSSDLSEFQYVTQLDPDAMTRQTRKLESHDEQFERATWLGCFHLLRRGNTMTQIRDWCSERTEVWRAVASSAVPISVNDVDDNQDFDPSAAILWRRVCYALVKQSGTEDFERAFYGVLSGDLSSVLKVGNSWDDYMFAHYNALLRTQFDSHLVSQVGANLSPATLSLPAFDASQFLGENAGLAKRLVSALETDPSYPKTARREAATAGKTLQGAIIANTLDPHFFRQGKTIAIEANQGEKSHLIPLDLDQTAPDGMVTKYYQISDQYGLRLAAHVLIILYTLSKRNGRDSSIGISHSSTNTEENTLVAYIMYLRMAYLEEMLPLYCSKLSGDRRYEVLSQNVIHILDTEQRATQLNLLTRYGLDLRTFLRMHPMNFFQQLQDQDETRPDLQSYKIVQSGKPTLKYGRGIIKDFIGADSSIPRAQLRVIKAMEWFTLSNCLLLEACEYSVKIYKYFLLHKDLRAARALYEAVNIRHLFREQTTQELPEQTDIDTLTEYLVQARAARHLPNDDADLEVLAVAMKNTFEMEALVQALDNIETIGAIAEIASDAPRVGKEIVGNLGKAIKDARSSMSLVLHGWMLETADEDDAIIQIREIFIPETILAYISALQFTGTMLTRDYLLECMDLAPIIAAKDSDLAPLFLKTRRMKELVEAFASASKALAYTNDLVGSGGAGGASNTGGGASTKVSKLAKDKGWSKDIWSVRS